MSVKLSDIENTNTNNIITPERYVFWLDDLTVLYNNQNYIKFVPTSDMSRIEQLNALTRFCIYLLILLRRRF